MLTEGVIQFQADHESERMSLARFAQRYDDRLAALSAWREVFVRLEGLGQNPERYEGYGFGNLSTRIGPFPGQRGERAFLITGTQSGDVVCMGPEHYCVVNEYSITENKVKSFGPILPSSESLTHGAIYDLSPLVKAVVHIHAPSIFHAAKALKLPTTPKEVGYGTQAMADSVKRLFRHQNECGTFVMAGHEDGVVCFGKSLTEASQEAINVIVAASAMAFKARSCVGRSIP